MSNSILMLAAFQKVIPEEDLKWIQGILQEFQKRMEQLIDGADGEKYAKKYVLSDVKGFILCEQTIMGSATDVVLGSPYFGRVIPFIGRAHYPKASCNHMITAKMTDVMVKYIGFHGFKVGISDGNNNPVIDGEIVLYQD